MQLLKPEGKKAFICLSMAFLERFTTPKTDTF